MQWIDRVVKYWMRGWAYEVWYRDGRVITYPSKTREIKRFIKGKRAEVQYSRDFRKWEWVYR